MRCSLRYLILLSLAGMSVCPAVFAAPSGSEPYHLGDVQIKGKDAQTRALSAMEAGELRMEMGKRVLPMPDLLPDPVEEKQLPLTAKAPPDRPATIKRDQIKVSGALGTEKSRELHVQGRGSYNGYVANFRLASEGRNGYRSDVDNYLGFGRLSLSTSEDDSFTISGFADFGKNTFPEAGTKDRPTPTAGVEDSWIRFGVKGHTTLGDGAFFTGSLSGDSITRNVYHSRANFSEESTLSSTLLSAEYRKELQPSLKGKAALSLHRDSHAVDNGPTTDLTKTTVLLTGEYDFRQRSFLELGMKSQSLMGRDRFSPFLRYDYRWAKPWQLVFTYEEDLGNDNLEQIFRPQRYVPGAALTASRVMRSQGSVNYRSGNGKSLFGADVFREKEQDSIEFIDDHDGVKDMLVSRFRFVPDASRTGLRVRGTFSFDENFSLGLAHTYQTPKDEASGRRLSYEPKRIFDLNLAYEEKRLRLDFTRTARFDRIAYTPTTSVNAGDYSRSDITAKYTVNDKFQVYLKIKDLYDEGDALRCNVPEEGRISMLGLETSF